MISSGKTEAMLEMKAADLENAALSAFERQYEGNSVYRTYCDLLGISDPESLEEIPFLPIEFFKYHDIRKGNWEPEMIFESSGTGSGTTSKVPVRSLEDYRKISMRIFESNYGPPGDYVLLALLPSYLERGNSSLVKMVQWLIDASGNELSGTFLADHDELLRRYEQALHEGKRVMIWGVSFALLDLAVRPKVDLSKAVIVETGGMKGRRNEIVREELHSILRMKLGAKRIHSEYGMTELMSQAYSRGDGMFSTPAWMRVLIRDTNDPLAVSTGHGKTGALNIVDLGNENTCPFIATQDIGKLHKNGHFEVNGRLDNSDIRGCNLMII